MGIWLVATRLGDKLPGLSVPPRRTADGRARQVVAAGGSPQCRCVRDPLTCKPQSIVASVSRFGGCAVKQYTILYEKGKQNWSAYVPDVPGCIATGKTCRT